MLELGETPVLGVLGGIELGFSLLMRGVVVDILLVLPVGLLTDVGVLLSDLVPDCTFVAEPERDLVPPVTVTVLTLGPLCDAELKRDLVPPVTVAVLISGPLLDAEPEGDLVPPVTVTVLTLGPLCDAEPELLA